MTGQLERTVTGLPKAAEVFVSFATVLRANGFAASADQTESFLSAVHLLGPKSITDIHRAAFAVFAPIPERHDAFDALFRLHFLGQGELVRQPSDAEDDDEMRVQEEDDQGIVPPDGEDINETGEQATAAEALSTRTFDAEEEAHILRRFRRSAKRHLPLRRGYRRIRAKRGASIDLRRAMRRAVAHDGEVVTLPNLRRKSRQRRILLLVDVSGSMKEQTDHYLGFAHAMAQTAETIEIFTFGTRLTRITTAMQFKNRDRALDAASATVSDWDGGTRIGDALSAFLAVPRFAGFARGALVLVLSDGLERGDTDRMVDAVTRLSRRAWRLVWLNPLATGPNFSPETAGLKAVLPVIDDLVDASSLDRLCDHVLDIADRRGA